MNKAAASTLAMSAAAEQAAAGALRALNAGDREDALRQAQDALRHDPHHVEALRIVARLAFDRGEARAALAAADALCAIRPSDADGLAIRARALARLGEPAARAARVALQARANVDPAAAYGVALLALDCKDGFEALRWLDRAAALDPNSAAVRGLRAACLARLGRLREAQDDYDAALTLEPKLFRARIGRAKLRSALGDFARAETDLRAALAESPASAAALSVLLGLRPQDEATLLACAREILGKQALDWPERVELSYAAAKALARSGQFGEAFAIAAEANALQAARAPYDASAAETALEHDLGLVPRRESVVRDSPQPIFVCGLPRSGTTLTEQILARHPAVAAGGELPFFRKAQAWLAAQSEPAIALARQRDEFARAYCDGLAARAGGRPFIVDKMPENWRLLGLIQHVLGPVRIVRMQRDARDTALSIFLEHFATAESFAHDVEGIAHAIRLERRAFRHWARAAPRPPAIVSYERLAAQPAAEIPVLLGALGLEDHPACLAPEESKAPAATPSRWQVRQKINAGSVGRWRAYKAHAPEFFRKIAEAACASGEQAL